MNEYSSINEPYYRNARRPVSSIPILYEWHEEYEPVFDLQVETIRQDLMLARKRNKFIAYLSCPISRRGGGSRSTNVAIAEFVQGRIEAKWGGKLWALNPAEYQMDTEIGKERFYLNSRTIKEEKIYEIWQEIYISNLDGKIIEKKYNDCSFYYNWKFSFLII